MASLREEETKWVGRSDLVRLTPSAAQHLRGSQGALWGETLRSPARLEYLLMPRLIAVAERGWTPAPSPWRSDRLASLAFAALFVAG